MNKSDIKEYLSYMQYPVDGSALITKKKRIKRVFLENLSNPIHKKIAVLGGSTTNELVDQLDLFLLSHGIFGDFYQSEYNRYYEDAVFGTELLDFSPDIIYVHTTWRNIEFPSVVDSADEIERKFSLSSQHFKHMWDVLQQRFSCPIIQNNFERPNHRLLGNRDVWDLHGKSNFVSRLNQFIYQYAQMHSNFYICDVDFLSGEFGLSRWNDAFSWHMYKYALNINAVPLLAKSVASIIKSIYGKNKKALVLDLDNTLWGGVVGDVGVEEIAIGPEIPEGQVYAEFQQYCRSLKQLGVILAINSKNDEKNAILGLKHPNSVLSPDDFSCIKANWMPKDHNLKEIAKELNIGSDSFVFVDDNPAEREIIALNFPEVVTPPLDSVEHYIEMIDHENFFEITTFSEEDRAKTEMYQANAKRLEFSTSFSNYTDYLDNLQMCATITAFEPIAFQRISQLTNKSNQFNLTTLRCSESDISKMSFSDNYITIQAQLDDKFGKNGIVSLVSGEIDGDVLHIRLWLMSCRVLKRGLEDAVMNYLIGVCREKSIKTVVGYYYPTAKNEMVRSFYESYGFVKDLSSENGDKWLLQTKSYVPKELHMKLNERNEK